MQGRIVVIEGTDCSGKETQTSLLFQRLKKEGYKVERFSFPMYDTPTGKVVGTSYLGREDNSFFPEGAAKVDPKVSALYFAADRKYNIAKIDDLLKEGYIVILDRYVESNMFQQACKLSSIEERYALYKWLEELEYGLLELPKPDLTIGLHMPYNKVLELKKGRIGHDSNESSLEYLKNSELAFMELVELKGHTLINCAINNKLRDILDIHEEIYQTLMNKLALDIDKC